MRPLAVTLGLSALIASGALAPADLPEQDRERLRTRLGPNGPCRLPDPPAPVVHYDYSEEINGLSKRRRRRLRARRKRERSS